MSIIPNSFRKQKKYITDENGDHELVSTWTSTDTVETTDGETLTDYLDSHVDLTIDVTTPSEVAKRYTFTQNDTVIGVVDIPLDMVVSAATVETVVTPDVPYEGAEVGDKYIDMVIANSSEDHIYIPCKDIISADSVEIVKQTPTDSTDATYELLFSGTADNTEHTEGVRKSQYATFNPDKKAFTFGARKSGSTVGSYSYVEGYKATASGSYSHAEGSQTTASSPCSHAEGANTTASGYYSHAEGSSTTASGDNSHAEGYGTIASGQFSHAEGNNTTASSSYSHAEGFHSKARGTCSHAEGNYTIANHKSQHIFGEYNIEDPSTAESTNRGTYVEIVGNGTDFDSRSNARTLDWDGNEILSGTLTTTDVINSTTWDGTNTSLKDAIADCSGGGGLEYWQETETSINKSEDAVLGWNSDFVKDGLLYTEIQQDDTELTVISDPSIVEGRDIIVAIANEVVINGVIKRIPLILASTYAWTKYKYDRTAQTGDTTPYININGVDYYRAGVAANIPPRSELKGYTATNIEVLNDTFNSLNDAYDALIEAATIKGKAITGIGNGQDYVFYGGEAEGVSPAINDLPYTVDKEGNVKGKKFTQTATPTNDGDLATKAYADTKGETVRQKPITVNDTGAYPIILAHQPYGEGVDDENELVKKTSRLTYSFANNRVTFRDSNGSASMWIKDNDLELVTQTWDGTHTSLKDAIANAGGGTTVVANPTGTPTDELTSIQIGEDIYEIVGGGGGGNTELQKTVLLSTPITTTGTYTLADDYTNYDFIAIQAGNGSNEVDIHMYAVKEIISAMSNNLTVTNPNTGGWFNFTMNADELTIPGMQLSTINSVVGYKVVGGGGSGGSDAQIDTLFSANDYQENITLAHPYTDYDVLIINGIAPINNDLYQCSTTYITDEININNNIGAYTDGSVIWYNVNDTTHLSCIGRLDVYVTAIYGIKYGSGGGGGTNVIEKTQAQYNALTQPEKENGSIYMVKDHNDVIIELTEPQTSSSTKVTASSYMADYNLQQYHYPFGAFNRVSPTTWEYPTPGVTTETTWTPDISVDGTNSWIQYEFDAPVRMTSMKIWAFADYSSDTTKSFIIEGSNDGTTFTNILADGESSCNVTATLHQNYENIIDLDDTDSYTYVRLRSLEPMGASYQPTIFIDEIFVYGYGTTSVNRIYYMNTEYANTEVGSSESDADIVTYNATVTTSEYGWWIVEDENGNALDPSQYIIVDIVPRYDGHTETAVGCRWTINSNVDGSNTARYSVTLENINDGGFIRSPRTVELQVSYKLK